MNGFRSVNGVSGGGVGRSRLLDRLLSGTGGRSNNGTVAGALAHALQSGFAGYQHGQQVRAAKQDATDQTAAIEAMNQGMSAKPWEPPQGEPIFNGPGADAAPLSRADAMKRAAPAGGIEGALAALRGQGGNAYAGRLTQQLLSSKMQRDQSIADRNEQRAYDEETWGNRLDAQTGKEKELLQFRQENTPEPAETFANPVTVQGPDGQPMLVRYGNRGSVQPVEGYSPAPDASKEPGGPFSGNSEFAQINNILLTGDPASPEYAAAYNIAAQPKTRVDPTTGQMISISPNMSAYRPPVGVASSMGQNVNAGADPSAQGAPGAMPAAQPMPMPDNRGGVEVSQVPGMQGRQKFTEAESKAAGFASRMEGANTALNNVMAGPDGVPGTKDDYDPTGYWDATARGVPLVGNALQSKAGQNYYQAMQDWVTANLRKESGAVIGVEEMENEITKYFPVPGDGPEVMAQKAESRRRAEAGMRGSSGPAYDAVSRELDKTTPQVPATGPASPGAAPNSEEEAKSAPVGAIATSASGIQYRKVSNTGSPSDWQRVDADAIAAEGTGASGVR